jgi:hypothetical protein
MRQRRNSQPGRPHAAARVKSASFRGGIDDEAAVGAFAFADSADAFGGVQFEMNDAPLAGGHGIEAPGLPGFADALSGDASGKPEFLEAQSEERPAIETDAPGFLGREAQAAKSEILEGEEQFGVALEEHLGIEPAKIHFEIEIGARVRGRGADFILEIQAGRAEQPVEKPAQRSGGRAQVLQSTTELLFLHDLCGPGPEGYFAFLPHPFFGIGSVRIR